MGIPSSIARRLRFLWRLSSILMRTCPIYITFDTFITNVKLRYGDLSRNLKDELKEQHSRYGR